jgi:hypothetical protein
MCSLLKDITHAPLAQACAVRGAGVPSILRRRPWLRQGNQVHFLITAQKSSLFSLSCPNELLTTILSPRPESLFCDDWYEVPIFLGDGGSARRAHGLGLGRIVD